MCIRRVHARLAYVAVLSLCFLVGPGAFAAEDILTVKKASHPRLVVNPKRTVRAELPRNLYGINMQYNVVDIKHWQRDERRLKPQVMADMKSFPNGMFRFPGGLPSNAFDWEASVVPYNKRIDKRKSEGNLSVNTYFGVDEYLQFIKDVETWTPWYVLNLIGEGTERKPIEWSSWKVANKNQRLAQHIKEKTPQLNVRYYQLGNELDRNKFQWSYEKYVSRSLETIRKIQAVDPKARFVPFMREFHWEYQPPLSGQGRADKYFDVVMKGLPMVKDFSLHYYFDGKLSPSHPYLTVPQVVDKILLAEQYAKEARNDNYNIWITEYSKRFYLFGDTPPDSGTSLDTALAQADFLIALAQMPVVKGAFMQGFDGGDRKMYYDSNNPTSSFWALRILANQPYRRVLASQNYSPNSSGYQGGYDVRAVALTNATGNKLGINAVNRSRQGKTLKIEYPPMAGKSVVEKRRFVKGPEGKNPKFVEKGFTVQRTPISKSKKFDKDGGITVWLPPLSVSAITFE